MTSAMSPLISGRLSPAAHEIRICGSANSSARNRSASTCRPWMSERSRASILVARTRVRISRIAATTVKPSSASAVVRTANSWWFSSNRPEIWFSRVGSSARAAVDVIPAARPVNAKRDQAVARQRCARQQRPTHRHDHARHRLPQTARHCARRVPAVRESNDNIPSGSRPVRVQTVNAKSHREKMPRRLTKINPDFTGTIAFRASGTRFA